MPMDIPKRPDAEAEDCAAISFSHVGCSCCMPCVFSRPCVRQKGTIRSSQICLCLYFHTALDCIWVLVQENTHSLALSAEYVFVRIFMRILACMSAACLLALLACSLAIWLAGCAVLCCAVLLLCVALLCVTLLSVALCCVVFAFAFAFALLACMLARSLARSHACLFACLLACFIARMHV